MRNIHLDERTSKNPGANRFLFLTDIPSSIGSLHFLPVGTQLEEVTCLFMSQLRGDKEQLTEGVGLVISDVRPRQKAF